MPNQLVNGFRQSGLRFLWLSLIVIMIDQLSKQWVIANYALYQSEQFLPFFNLTYVRNYGAAFSFLHDAGGWQRWFFTLIAGAVSLLIVWWLKQTKSKQLLLSVAFCLILGGAIGNVVDRVIYGYVIDFLDFYLGQWHWPAFNVADSAIFIGAVLLLIDMYKNGEQEKSS